MIAERIIQKMIGRDDFELSNQIPTIYIFDKGIVYLIGLLRGMLKRIRIASVGKKLIVGKNVRLLAKSQIELGDNVRIENNVSIDALSSNGVRLKNRVKLGERSKIVCSGSLSKIGKGIIIGNDSSFSENTFFGAAGGITIGDDVIAGQNVRFHAENHNFSNLDVLIRKQGVNHKGIIIGNNVWIGSGAIILDGTVLGDGCVVAAGAVVNGKHSENVILGGIPAKEIRKR